MFDTQSPTSWPRAFLGQVAAINPRLNDKPVSDTIVSFVPMSALSAIGARVDQEESRTYDKVSKGYTAFQKGDLLVAKITPCFQNNKIGQAIISRALGFGSTEFHVIRASELADPRYLLHYLRQDRIRIEGERKMTGSAGQRRVPEHFLSMLEVPLPPLPEQRRIAAILDQADALRASRQAALAQLDEMAQAVFVGLFGDPAINSRSWPIVPLADLVASGDTINYGVIQPGEDVEEGTPLVRVGDLLAGGVDHRSLKRISDKVEKKYKRSRLKGDEILISCVGSIGSVALTTLKEQGFNIARAVARVRVSNLVDRRFVAAYLRSKHVQDYFQRELRTVSQPTLNIKQICETRVFVPPVSEQQKFSQHLDAIETLMKDYVASAEHLQTLWLALQHRALTGAL